MPTLTPDQTVAEAIATALVEAQLFPAGDQTKIIERIAGGQMTAADWQTQLKLALAVAPKS